MTFNRFHLSALLVAWMAGSVAAAGAGAAEGLRLEVDAPPELEAAARRIRELGPERLEGVLRLLGIARGGPPIRVMLVPEDDDRARRAPSWVAGYAYSELGVVFLFPERAPTYPDSDLDELLRHEVGHVLLHRAAAGRPVPRWFNEGLAMVASGAWDLEDRSRLTLALLLEERTPLARLDRRFAGGRGEIFRAYALSGAVVREMLRAFGPGTGADILRRVAVGVDFEEAFRRSTGVELEGFEHGFWKRYSVWYRWLPLATSSATLWLGIVLLALWAGRRRRRRRLELERMWAEEERRSLARRIGPGRSAVGPERPGQEDPARNAPRRSSAESDLR